MSALNFLSHNSIFYLSNTMNLNIFHNHRGIYTLVRKFKICGEMKPNGVQRNMLQQNKMTLILKWGLRHLPRTSTQGSGKFQGKPVSFYFVTKKNSF